MKAAERAMVLYLVRAAWEWCCDNGERAHLLVRIDGKTELPSVRSAGGVVKLDISRSAVRNLRFEEDAVCFTASFSRAAHDLAISVEDIAWVGAPSRRVGFSPMAMLAMAAQIADADEQPLAEKADPVVAARKAPAAKRPANGKPKLRLV